MKWPNFVPDISEAWCMHPIFRAGHEAGKLLRAQTQPASAIPIPPTIPHRSGEEFQPYADYYYHWQAYALLDVFLHAGSIRPRVMNTPNAAQKAESVVRNVDYKKNRNSNPTWVLSATNGWGTWQ